MLALYNGCFILSSNPVIGIILILQIRKLNLEIKQQVQYTQLKHLCIIFANNF